MTGLGVDRCLVAGASAGGPHALASGALRPERVAGVLSIASLAPDGLADLELTEGMGAQNIEEFGLARQGEADLRPWLEREAVGMAGADATDLVAAMHTLLPAVDRAVLITELGEDLAASFSEGLRTGVQGWLDDDLAFVQPWGFELAQVAVPVFVWQGSEDLMVPPAHGRWLARNVAGATVHLEQGQGHLSIAVSSIDRMLDELLAVLPR
jgi:pimeloyl-ACP methyl ester carboxylesterase